MAKNSNGNGNGNSTAIAVVGGVPEVEVAAYPALVPESGIAEAIEVNTRGEGFDLSSLVRVKTPAGGSKTWTYLDGGNNEVESKSIDGVLVYYGKRGTLWGTEEITKGRLPVLVSYDLRTAERVNDDLGDLDPAALEACRIGDRVYDWQRLPWNKDGTGKGGFGRRCKESRLLAVLQQGQAFPVIVSIGPGSLKTVSPFVTRLEVPHYRAVVSLSLDRAVSQGGIDYSQVVPRLVGRLSVEAGREVRRLYTDPLMAVERQFGNDDE